MTGCWHARSPQQRHPRDRIDTGHRPGRRKPKIGLSHHRLPAAGPCEVGRLDTVQRRPALQLSIPLRRLADQPARRRGSPRIARGRVGLPCRFGAKRANFRGFDPFAYRPGIFLIRTSHTVTLHRHTLAAATALLGFVGAAQAIAATSFVEIDLSGWQATAAFSEAGNSELTLLLGTGLQITGYDYLDLRFTSQGASFRSEFTLSVNDSTATGYMNWAPSDLLAPGGVGPLSGAWSGTQGAGTRSTARRQTTALRPSALIRHDAAAQH